jgi:cysteinyl-tRNA synthetase, unknown class
MADQQSMVSVLRGSALSVCMMCCLLFVIPPVHAQTGMSAKFEKWQQADYFKGFNVSAWNNVADAEVDQATFDSVRHTGANLVVLQTAGTREPSVPYLPTVWYAGESDTTYHVDLLDMMVDYARNAGLYYVIAVRSGPGRIDVAEEEVDNASTVWTTPTEQQLYGSMVKSMAARYLPDTLFVGLDLTVEPNPLPGVTDEPVQSEMVSLSAQGIDVNAVYTLWIDSVRTLDTDLPLMVQGIHLADPEFFASVTKQADEKIVYKVHVYNPAEFSHADQLDEATYPGNYWNVEIDALKYYDKTFLRDTVYAPVRTFQDAHDVPILLGEFGLQYPMQGGPQYLADIADIAEELGWHFALWNFNNGPQFYYQTMQQTDGTDYWSTVLDMFAAPVVSAPVPLQATNWAYQLQNLDIDSVAADSDFDLIVMDYSSDGSAEQQWTAAQIAQIQSGGKTAISYISIGEAENYRAYWQTGWDADGNGQPDSGAPDWLGPENPSWEGNYKVRFWDSDWQSVVYTLVDTIIAQGFDGIYCDIIDAYYYWSQEVSEQPAADSLMVLFLVNLRAHISAQTVRDFYIIPQNGEYIIWETHVSDDTRAMFFDAIDGIGVEDVFHPGDLDEDNSYNPDTDRLEALQEFVDQEKVVLSVEYLTDTTLQSQYIQAAQQQGFVPTVTVRALNVLNGGETTVDDTPAFVIPPLALDVIDTPNDIGGSVTLRFIASPHHPGASGDVDDTDPLTGYLVLAGSDDDSASAVIIDTLAVDVTSLGANDTVSVAIDIDTGSDSRYYWMRAMIDTRLSGLAGPNRGRALHNARAALGDLDGSGEVDIWDVAIVAEIFGVTDEYDPTVDLNGNEEIDIWDVSEIAKVFGQTIE